MHLSHWGLTLKVVACTFHGVAIASTIFRLLYRWHITCFWWEDWWAAIALVAEVPCLVSALLAVPQTGRASPHMDRISYWMAGLGFPCVLWACRTSILLSIVRVANPSRSFRRVTCLVGGSFFLMWAALMAQKIQICITDDCKIAAPVGIAQLITDAISDGSLVALPIYFLRRTKISPRQRIMIMSAFSASLLITVVTIVHSAVLFTIGLGWIIVIGHVKTALSLVICNLLVIVAFVYRMCRRGSDLDTAEETIVFTTVNIVYPTTMGTVDKY